jgi:hypothetical protein
LWYRLQCAAVITTHVKSSFHPMQGRQSEVHISFPVGTDRMSLHYEPLRDGSYLRFGLQNNSIQLTWPVTRIPLFQCAVGCVLTQREKENLSDITSSGKDRFISFMTFVSWRLFLYFV